MRYLVPLAIIGLLGACEAPVSSPELHPTLQSIHAWSRGEVRISDPAFALSTTPPTLTAGSRTLVVRVVDDTTIAATLPDTAGAVTLSVHAFGAAVPVGPVIVAGFVGTTTGRGLQGRPLPWPTGNPTGVIAGGDSGAVFVSLASGAVMRVFAESLHSTHCVLFGPGASIIPGRVVFYGWPCRRPVSWQLDPLSEGDSLHGFRDTWVLAELGHRRSLATSDDSMYLANCDTSPCQVATLPGGGILGVEFSSRGDRAALIQADVVPPSVLDPREPAVAYSIPSLSYAWGAAFSDAGDTLFIAGSDSTTARRGVLLALDATTGAVSRSLPLPLSSLGVKDLALDPAGQWIYVAARVTGDHPALFVVDRRTWTVSGVLTAHSVQLPTLDVFDRIIPSPGSGLIYVVISNHILKYSRLP